MERQRHIQRNGRRLWAAIIIGTCAAAGIVCGTAQFKAPLGLLDAAVQWCRWDANGVIWCRDIDVNSPSLVYALDHNSFSGYVAHQHIDWTRNQSPTHMIDPNNIDVNGVTGGIASGVDPDVNAPGQVSADTNDFSLRGYDGTNQFAYGKKWKTFNVPVDRPHNIPTAAGRATKSRCVICNRSTLNFVITEILAVSDVDDYAFNLYESYSETDIGTGNDTLIDAVTCSTNGTSCFYDKQTTITHATIEPTHHIIFEHVSGTANALTIYVTGYYNADKN